MKAEYRSNLSMQPPIFIHLLFPYLVSYLLILHWVFVRLKGWYPTLLDSILCKEGKLPGPTRARISSMVNFGVLIADISFPVFIKLL